MTAISIVDDGAVRHLVLCRPAEYNTITVELRDGLSASLDEAERDRNVKVVLLRAQGPAFCAGFGFDWSTLGQATNENVERVWDSMADLQGIGRFANAFAKLSSINKPTLAAVHGWCIAGGTDMVLNADIIIAGESARLFDGVARHTQEGLDFVTRSQGVGWRQAVRERDEPFGDYGSRPRPL